MEQILGPLNRAFAQKAWGSAGLYSTWARMQSTVNAVGKAPGFIDTPYSGDPGATSLPGSKAVVFGSTQNEFEVLADGGIKHAYWAGGAVQTELLAPAGTAVGNPVAFSSGNHLHVFARGTDGHPHHWLTGSVPGTWVGDDWTAKAAANGFPSLTTASDPAGFVYAGQQHVFGRGADGTLHHWWYNPSSNLVTADNWGGQMTSNPAAVAWGDLQTVVARGTDGTLWQWWWEPSDPNYVHQKSWGGQVATSASPSALDYSDAQLDAFFRDPNGHEQNFSYDQWAGAIGQYDLTALGGFSAAGNVAAYVYKTQVHTFFRDASNSHLDHVWFTPGGDVAADDWTTKAPGNANPAKDPAGFDYQDIQQHAFALDAGGHLQH